MAIAILQLVPCDRAERGAAAPTADGLLRPLADRARQRRHALHHPWRPCRRRGRRRLCGEALLLALGVLGAAALRPSARRPEQLLGRQRLRRRRPRLVDRPPARGEFEHQVVRPAMASLSAPASKQWARRLKCGLWGLLWHRRGHACKQAPQIAREAKASHFRHLRGAQHWQPRTVLPWSRHRVGRRLGGRRRRGARSPRCARFRSAPSASPTMPTSAP